MAGALGSMPRWYRKMCEQLSRASWRGQVTLRESQALLDFWHPVALREMFGRAAIDCLLTPADCRLATDVGRGRQSRRTRAGHRNAHGSMDAGEDHVLGAHGECAYSRLSGRPWTGATSDITSDDDVDGVQVRTRRDHSYDLYLWPEDKQDAWWVLMTGMPPAFKYWGRIWGKAACIDAHFTVANRRGFPREDCYVVPRQKLEMEVFS